MYLRSGKLKQTTINFPCRKRRQEAGSLKEQDSYSSTKRTTSIPSRTQKLRCELFFASIEICEGEVIVSHSEKVYSRVRDRRQNVAVLRR